MRDYFFTKKKVIRYSPTKVYSVEFVFRKYRNLRSQYMPERYSITCVSTNLLKIYSKMRSYAIDLS